MTDQDKLMIAATGLVAVWWLWRHPAAARAIGWVVLFGLVCFGVAHAQTHARRQHRSPRRSSYHRRSFASGLIETRVNSLCL
jgi:hypothetical protein